jgi:hypothetical protein
VQRDGVAGLEQHGQRLVGQRLQPFRGAFRRDVREDDAVLQSPTELADPVTSARGALGQRLRLPKSLLAPARVCECLRELELERDVDLRLRQERQRAAAPKSARASAREPAAVRRPLAAAPSAASSGNPTSTRYVHACSRW